MIAMIVGDEDMRMGPIPFALAYAGFEARETCTTDEAEYTVGMHGAKDCVLVVDAGMLDRRAGSATWNTFLTSHRAVAAVVVTRVGAPPEMQAAASEPHRILLENPFDAAAVVAAARRASAAPRLPVRRARQPLREAG
jgi:DNA-binding NtrC family response regulator